MVMWIRLVHSVLTNLRRMGNRPEAFNESVFSEIEKENIQRIQAEIDRRSR